MVPWWRTGINWICGIEKHPERPEITDAEKEDLERKATSLEERGVHKLLCDFNAVVLISFGVFFWTFFA